ncbi:MAG: diaminopimelate epimerase [Candidatus Syntropharchaeia archaeon]
MILTFTKAHGTGNDFIILDESTVSEDKMPELVRKLCERRFSIGADGVLFVCKSDICDVRMRIFNSDGSEAEMSGNGMRCFARYLYEKGIVRKEKITVETMAGRVVPEIILEDGKIRAVRVYMGKASFERKKIPMRGKETYAINTDFYVNEKFGSVKLTALSLGNPHAVIVVEDLYDIDVGELGAAIESHPDFPNRTNVQFVEINDKNDIDVRTYERGVGETLSCGTGSTASVFALDALGYIDRKKSVIVHTFGGTLFVELKEDGAYLTGPAEIVFDGRMEIEDKYVA